MGAFSEGFRMGGDMYDSAERIRLAKEQQELAKKEFGLREEQHGWQRSAEEGKVALREAIAAQGDLYTSSPEKVMAGPAPQGMPQEGGYAIPGATPEQKLANIQQRALMGGANPADLQTFMTGHLALGNAQRLAKLDAQFDAAMNTLHKESADRLTGIQTTAQGGGLKGLADTFGPELKKAFGHDVKYNPVPGGNGEIVVMDGKKVLTRITDLGQATSALEKLAQQEFADKYEKAMLRPGMFKSGAELTTYLNKREELKNQGITAQAAAKNAETNAAVGGAHINYYNSFATKNNQTTAGAFEDKIKGLSKVYMDADPNMSLADARKKAAQELVKSPDARANAVTPADINAFITANMDQMVKPDPNRKGKTIPMTPTERAAAARLALTGGVPTGGMPDLGEGGLGAPGNPANPAPAPGPGPATPALPTGTREELRAQANKIDQDIALLRRSGGLQTPIAQREEINKQISALQAQRQATLSALARTPGPIINNNVAFPVPRP